MADPFDGMFAEEAPEQTPEPVEEVPAEQIEAPEPEPVEEPAPQPVEQPRDSEGRHVPLPTFLDVRDRLKAAELERDQLRQQYAASQRPQQVPDPYDDPQAFQSYQQQAFDNALQAQKLNISYELAKDKHGQDTVDAARNWAVERAQSDPRFHASLEAAMKLETLPLDWIVRQHKREALLSDVGDDPDAWVRRRAAELGLVPSAPTAAAPVAVNPQQAIPPVKVPRSLATQGSAQSDLRDVATGPLAAADSLFLR